MIGQMPRQKTKPPFSRAAFLSVWFCYAFLGANTLTPIIDYLAEERLTFKVVDYLAELEAAKNKIQRKQRKTRATK